MFIRGGHRGLPDRPLNGGYSLILGSFLRSKRGWSRERSDLDNQMHLPIYLKPISVLQGN